MVLMFQAFNQTGQFGLIIDSMTQHWTGSESMTLIIILMVLLLVASFYHMPEILVIIPLLPVLLVFSTIAPELQMIVGVLALFLGYILYTIFPWR